MHQALKTISCHFRCNAFTNSNILFHFAISLFFILLFLLIYFPVTQGHYFYGEEYAWIWTSERQVATQQSYVLYMREQPFELRPLALLWKYVIYNKYINSLKSVEAANAVRFIGIIGIGLLAYVLFLIFKENRFRTEHAFLLSILICTLPPFQVYVGRFACVVFIYSVLLSALSAMVLFKAVFKESKGKIANIVIAVLSTMVLLIMALSIYQPTAMSYWAMALIPLIRIKNEDFTKKWRLPFTIYFSTGFASMIIYFGIIKIIILLTNVVVSERANFIWRTDIYPRIIWFIKDALYTASNLWNIVRTEEVALLVSTVIFASFFYGFGRMGLQIMVERKGINLLLNSLCRYLLILIIVPLSYLPQLIVKSHLLGQELPLYRTLIGLEITVFMLFYWGLANITEFSKSVFKFSEDLQKKIITIGLVILTVGAAFLANHNVDKYFAKRHTDEYIYVKDVIQGYGVSKLSKVSKIYVIGPGKDARKYFSIYYDFGQPSSGQRANAISMVKLALYELGINSDIPIDYINIHIEDPVPEDKNALFIDMNKFQLDWD